MAAFGTDYRGDVVGRYGAEGVAHGYLLLRGRFITVDPPGSAFTAARGIDHLDRAQGEVRPDEPVPPERERSAPKI